MRIDSCHSDSAGSLLSPENESMKSASISVEPNPKQAPADTIPLISVIVATFNRAAWLREALATLVRQRTDGRFDYEVVVVDNASSDETRDVVENFQSPVAIRYLYQSQPGHAPT